MSSTLAFSFTLLEAEEQCPEKMRRLYVTKDKKRAFTAARGAGINIHKALEDRVKSRTPLPAEAAHFEKIVASLERIAPLQGEVSLAVDHWLKPSSFWGSSGIGAQTVPWMRGKVDVIARVPERRSALVVDWKSGRADYEKELQSEISALLLMCNDPNVDTVHAFNVYTKTAQTGRTYSFARSEMSPRIARLVKHTREIEARDPKQVWERRPSGLCPWCPVDDCPNFQGGQGRT